MIGMTISHYKILEKLGSDGITINYLFHKNILSFLFKTVSVS
jgi:hypothetical protein